MSKSTKLVFGDPAETQGYVDAYDERTGALSGWIVSRAEIRGVSAIIGKQRVECVMGGARPDVEKVHGGRYPAAGRSGFETRLRPGLSSVSLRVELAGDSGAVMAKVALPVEVPDSQYLHDDVPLSQTIAYGKWQDLLVAMCNRPGMRVLEVGSRRVTKGAPMRSRFDAAEYVGFDYHAGPNVDVVGDAHRLSEHVTGKFDLVFSSAVFEHLAMPWIVAEETARVLKVGGHVFVETHYSYASHERPWHFFQFSEMALKVLFSPALGFECVEAGVSNPLVGRFSSLAAPHLNQKRVTGLYCHSELLAKKVRDVPDFRWDAGDVETLVEATEYPAPSGS